MPGKPHPLLIRDYPRFATKPRRASEVRRRATLIRECWTADERAKRLARKPPLPWMPPVVRVLGSFGFDDDAT